MTDLHIYLPEGFSGVVHVHLHENTVDIDARLGGEIAYDGLALPATTAEIEAILNRHEEYEPQTHSREVYEALVNAGWEAFAPMNRSGNAPSTAPYIRFVYQGSKRRVVLYLNSVALVSNGAADRLFASGLDGADVHSSDVYFYHSEGRVELALTNAVALRTYADGEEQPA